ncbi:hypothetical protein [Aquisalimonas sp.]|uniref:hypothetical protein n=1 Tax=Aquisalimonas sp. TaxID=1872621 RepID=UPI0025BDB257|nr:hypothetical protein [Aquisalimonas sp.]
MSELLLIVAAAGAVALILWLRRRRGNAAGNENDALTRACWGDREQARRLEDLEHDRATTPLSRRSARRRALERLKDDRGR